MDAAQRPTPQQVARLQAEYPRLDYLMCETLLLQTEDQLARYLEAPEEKNKVLEDKKDKEWQPLSKTAA